MQRILILSNDSFMLWKFRRELISTMIASDMTVSLAVPAGRHADDLQSLGCNLLDTGRYHPVTGSRLAYNLYRRYLQLLRSEKPEMVVTYGAAPNVLGGLACRKLGIPYCANVQGLENLFNAPITGGFSAFLYKAALKKAKTVFFENSGNAAFFRKKKITPATRQTLLPGAGVNLQYYALQPYPDHSVTRFLYVGQMKKEKGTDELLDAIKMLYDDCYEVCLDLVGAFDESYTEQMQVLKDMGIVRHHGFQADPRPYYASADCVVMPSHQEGMNNVLLEAAAIGRPVVASYIPGCREAMEEGTTGFSFRVQDKYGLYDAMKKFAELSHQQRMEMGLAGRRRMEELFDKNYVVEDTMNAIFRV